MWKDSCESRYGRVPAANNMSIQELEDTLLLVGDTEIAAMKLKIEPLYDGKMDRIMWDREKEDVGYAFVGSPEFGEQQVYCHKTHLMNFFVEGDAVRFAVHMNKEGKPQVSFMDRLNNRAVDPRGVNPSKGGDRSIMPPGKGDGSGGNYGDAGKKGGKKGKFGKGKGYDGGWDDGGWGGKGKGGKSKEPRPWSRHEVE